MPQRLAVGACRPALLGNPLIIWGVVLEVALVLLIDYTPWGNLLLGTSPVAGAVWLFIVPFAAGLLVLEELRKWLVRGRQTAMHGAGRRTHRTPLDVDQRPNLFAA